MSSEVVLSGRHPESLDIHLIPDFSSSTWSWMLPPHLPHNNTRTPPTCSPPWQLPHSPSSPDLFARRAPLLPFPPQSLSRISSHIIILVLLRLALLLGNFLTLLLHQIFLHGAHLFCLFRHSLFQGYLLTLSESLFTVLTTLSIQHCCL